MTSASSQTDALLLRSVDYGDADRIVTLLTTRFGKAAFIARGARRSKKRFAGALEPLCLLAVEVRQGAAELGTLMSAQIARSFPRVLANLSAMSAGFAALELVRELSAEHAPEPEVFATTLQLLEALDAHEAAPERLLLCFEVRLLGLLGFAPRLDSCGVCGKRPGDGQAGLFDPQLGHLTCRRCGGASHRLGGVARAQLVRASGSGWVDAAMPPWKQSELAETREALRAFVEQRIGHALRAPSSFPGAEKRPA
ncbi:MAG: DNA repair protein RecO [Polyangiales bacterium]